MDATKPIIEVRGLGKRYDIAHMRGGYVALRDVIAGIFRNPLGYLKSRAKAAVGLAKREQFWALRNVSFSIGRGEIVGVIGANGAGKSTLLKILSQITPPTEGEVVVRGRIGSLLEVGTGFHPELSGRENIFLNGAILGMKRREIAARFDEIVAFAGIEKFLDTPVKYYSSGMYVRLAFSVAAHMEPDILVVDEVLAVGDAEFQERCLGKMDEITKKEGRTVVFVSHNMGAIERLCRKTAVMRNGAVEFFGETEKAIDFYTKNLSAHIGSKSLLERKKRRGAGNVMIERVTLYDEQGESVGSALSGDKVWIGISYSSKSPSPLEGSRFALAVKSLYGDNLFLCSSDLSVKGGMSVPPRGEVRCAIDRLPLNRGKYLVDALIQVGKTVEDHIVDAAVLEVENGDFFGTGAMPVHWEGRGVLVEHEWAIKEERS